MDKTNWLYTIEYWWDDNRKKWCAKFNVQTGCSTTSTMLNRFSQDQEPQVRAYLEEHYPNATLIAQKAVGWL